MSFETLNNGSFKRIAIGVTVSIFLFSVLILSLSLAKYRSTNSINIAKGTIKYNRPDLHLAEVYVESDAGEYVLASEVPKSGYVLNEDTTKTKCKNKDESFADIIITYENGGLTFSKLVNGGVKCYVYLDKKANAADKIPEGNPTDDNMFAGITGDGVYTWTKGDYSGGTQPIKYFRGNVNNNWVVFGKDGSNYIWWRIIRTNSNGSLRMIYAGTSSSKTSAPAKTGGGTQIGTKAYNTNYDNNAYVGFKYSSGQVHGNGTASIILGAENSTDATTLYGWYNTKLKTNYGSFIDLDAGFCNDRQPSTSASSFNGKGGTGSTNTYYGAYIRLITNKAPSLLCTSETDIFKTSVGLITADEVNMSGIGWDTALKNTSSYLYTNSNYWTMTPSRFADGHGWALVFFVNSNGCLYDVYSDVMSDYGVNLARGVRPVVNLKADTVFVSGNGEASTPFVVEGT